MVIKVTSTPNPPPLDNIGNLTPTHPPPLECLRHEQGAPTMRERLGASEADVERVADDDTTAVPASKAAAATKGKQKQPKKNKKKPTQGEHAVWVVTGGGGRIRDLNYRSLLLALNV